MTVSAPPKTDANSNSQPVPWHALEVLHAVNKLDSNEAGLHPDEAKRRLETHGPNQLPEPPKTSPLLRFLAQFNNTLIYFLLIAAAFAAFLGHFVDAAVIVAVVTINAIVGFIQEGKAESALDAIRNMIAPHATVLRNGEKQNIDARKIVPGDVVLLEAGDKVPADIRIMRARNLQINEAILTGESVPAEKHESPSQPDASLAERRSLGFSGTIVTTGQATGLVVATGSATEIGRISSLISQVQGLTTPLLEQINRFGKLITWAALALAAVLLLIALLVHQYDWADALMLVVALAVSVVPEGLPAVITITLAIGVQRMAARNAVVRRLPAVETLGATSVICSDKTGTLTKNEMTVACVVTATSTVDVTGAGYQPEGMLVEAGNETPARNDPARDQLVNAALLCNDAVLTHEDTHWITLGDPMEGALVTLALKSGLAQEEQRNSWQRLYEIPFDARHRYMATLHTTPSGKRVIFVKGAPETLLSLCQKQADLDTDQPIDITYWQEKIAAAAAQGQRILAFATKPAPRDKQDINPDDMASGLVFLGITGLIDPPRPEALSAIAQCRSAGISVKMITGDHGTTALAIARQLGIADNPEVLTGVEVDAFSDMDLQRAVKTVSVFARTSPEHKLRIVRALQENGDIAAMTGDGVNDAPSLKQADVGVAMGHKGTEAAKEAAEMVLLDDNFASIVAAVHEGRTVYDNIRKVISWTLPTNGGEILSVIIAIIFGLTLPMAPVHILWINMATTISLGLVLAFEPPEPGVMQRSPRKRDAPMLSPFLLWRMIFVSILFMLGVFAMFQFGLWRGLGETTARTMVVNAIVVMEIFYLFNVRYLHMTSFSLRGAMGTPPVLLAIIAVTAAQFLFTYTPFMQTMFETAPLSLLDGLVVVSTGVVLMIVLEIEKIVLRRLRLFASEV
ncbi:cation-transporting P-type ATPase [Agrobacterium sp.]|uniref:cation-transporting P-type ATPase n=1 Tax=Agrobacterium sp. TaxID=361 RepID=UPI0028AE07F5